MVSTLWLTSFVLAVNGECIRQKSGQDRTFSGTHVPEIDSEICPHDSLYDEGSGWISRMKRGRTLR